ncbi:S24 family peptidase [Vibrio scophthalmi]|uniref:LexA family transcriptional regulator n=1 Tax=Vibrio scophthalmi TaxID=45658 RepID=UPI003AB0CB49
MDISEEIKNLKAVTGTSTNVELASVLGISSKAISNWKSRGAIPDHILLKAQQLSTQEPQKQNLDIVELDFYDINASAGYGTLVEIETPTDISFSKSYLSKELHTHPDEVFMMRVGGDSMYPTLQDGALIVVKRINEFYGDGVYVFRINGQIMVKRLQFQPTKIIFKSDNFHLYEPWEVTHKELEDIDFQILGKVIWGGGKI